MTSTIPPATAPPTAHRKLVEWVEHWTSVLEPAHVHWCDGSDDEYAALTASLVESRHLRPDRPEAPAEQLLRPQRSRRRRPRRGPHLHLPRAGGRRRPDQQLARSRRDARQMLGLFTGAMRGRTMYVVPFSMGPLGSPIAHIGVELTDCAVRRREHADHDPHGQGCARRARRRRRVRALHPLGRHAARARPGRRALALQQRAQVHRALPGDARDLVVRLGLRRQRAARQEVLRAAHRVGDGARRGLARRAHAHSQAHESGR